MYNQRTFCDLITSHRDITAAMSWNGALHIPTLRRDNPVALEVIDPCVYPGWDDIVLASDRYSFFHTSYWARVLCDSYNYRARYLAQITDGKFRSLLPLMEVKSFITGEKGVSLPFSDFCDIVIANDEEFEVLMNFLFAYAKKACWKSIEIKDGRFVPPSTLNCSLYYEHFLDLTQGSERIFSRFKENTQRNIKKAMNMGVTVHRYDSLESIRDFYRLHCLTRKRYGLPPQPYIFFQNIFKHVISNNRGFVMLASYNNTSIAGAMYFHFGNQALFKYGASDMSYKQLRANNLVMWKAIEWFSRNRYEKLSLGRTEPDNEGLNRYKRGWGTNERTIKYYKYDLLKNAYVGKPYQSIKVHKKIFSMLPIFLLRIVGSLLYRHVA